jgi:hypothetical protein
MSKIPGSSVGTLPFGLGRPVPPVVTPLPAPDPKALISKRVEAMIQGTELG